MTNLDPAISASPTRVLRPARFPNTDALVAEFARSRPTNAVDVLLVNPPTPDGGIWIRSQHRVGRRSRENMVWPQVSLAQMAALLAPPYKVIIVDAVAERMTWPRFIELIEEHAPKFYVTQVTAPTLENDMYGTFLAKSRGARTMAFGTHVTPLPRETMKAFPSLDFVLVGEPELTLRDLIDCIEGRSQERSEELARLFAKHDGSYVAPGAGSTVDLSGVKGLAWRRKGEIVMNESRQFIQDLDDLPVPKHELLPLQSYRMPMLKGPFTFIVPNRGCPAACTYCIKHVTYQNSVRLRSPENVLHELWQLKKLGLRNVHMYSDLFTVDRSQVLGICQQMIDQRIEMKWTCNSRVDFVDEELLTKMALAGCHLIAWGLESGNEKILRNVRKGANPAKARQALTWARKARIKNWGYFIIGLPGETEATIRETIDFAKTLPLDIALFHIAAPYPGTPFFFEVIKNGWFRPGTRWEQVDMDKETVIDYPGLPAERLQYWQKRAFREWALRPAPLATLAKACITDLSTIPTLMNLCFQHLRWMTTSREKGSG
jgi:anaerobic magnesium-protoporphyrin IX monomethyl ester cyclase